MIKTKTESCILSELGSTFRFNCIYCVCSYFNNYGKQRSLSL